MIYTCREERRREAVSEHPSLNGIDYLEVSTDTTLPEEERRRTLLVHFVKPLTGPALTTENVRIEGGERIRNLRVESVTPGDDPEVLTVVADREGDFSTYTLRLTPGGSVPDLHAVFDPLLSAVEFFFRIDISGEFDPEPPYRRPPEELAEPALDYLAKDYASLRRLMLDRLSTLMPGWNERNPADLQVALVELLAYAGDNLGYRQDAVATEAYLGTARRRVSARRHARLVDYHMHDGRNARAWVQVRVEDEDVMLPKGTKLLTRVPGRPGKVPEDSPAYHEMVAAGAEVFETTHDAILYPWHAELRLYTWGARECCLPRGATRATINGDQGALDPGDVLVFKEARGPRTNRPEDADPTRRHAVRLTRVARTEDPLGGRFARPPGDDPVKITEIEWHPEDALPFPLCISAVTDEEHGREYVENVSVALGNIVLADHGLTLEDEEPLGAVPEARLRMPVAGGQGEGLRGRVRARFSPYLAEGPVTQAATTTVLDPGTGARRAAPFDPGASAAAATRPGTGDTLPGISLRGTDEDGNEVLWKPRRDLLRSGPHDPHFVAEVEADGTCRLRFGDDEFGLRPNSGTAFAASYRVGNGVRGNVGAGTIAHIVTDDPSVEGVSNPMPATGGTEPESIDEVRQNAPQAFRTQQRAVTPEDYAAVLLRHPGVQRAAASVRWTGSWSTVFLTVDRVGGGKIDEAFEKILRSHLEPYRTAGHDVEIDGPQYASLEVEMVVNVLPDYFRDEVEADLLEVFGGGTLPDGRRGVFHPDNFTFGQTVYLSPIYVAAQAVEGVEWVEVTKFQRQDAPDDEAREEGKLTLERLEIARLDNDPNFPERGAFRLVMQGGK